MKQIKARRAGKPAPTVLSPRNLVLAGLGAAVLARRESLKTLSRLDARSRRLRAQISAEAGAAGSRLSQLADSLRSRIETLGQPLLKRFEGLFGRAKQGRSVKRAAVRRPRATGRPAARKSVRSR
jgi:hypothetical protein